MRSVMRRAWSLSCAGRAPGIASSRCRSQGRSGFVAEGDGQARSLAWRNQIASKLEPADSSGPMIWMGAWRDSGAKSVSSAMRCRDESGGEGDAAAFKIERGEFVECALPLAAGLEFDAVELAGDGPAGCIEDLVEGRSPIGEAACGFGKVFAIHERD